jgi:hypothetical protein
MIIVHFAGGLGNQIYQYAFFLCLQKKYPNQEIKADLEQFIKSNVYDYGFGLKSIFNFDIPTAEKKDIKRILPPFLLYGFLSYDGKLPNAKLSMIYKDFLLYPYPFAIKPRILRFFLFVIWNAYSKISKRISKKAKNIIFEENIFNYNGNINYLDDNKNYYFYGYYQNIRYIRGFEDEVKCLLNSHLKPIITGRNKEILNKIIETDSVCIHIRYTGLEAKSVFQKHRVNLESYRYDVVSLPYYQEAIKIMEEKLKTRGISNPRYFIFTPLVEEAKKDFAFLDAEFVSESNTAINLYMIKSCSHVIIGYGTFAFWGAFLNDSKDKIVICPEFYRRSRNAFYEMNTPDDWIKIDNTNFIKHKYI